LSVWNNKWSDVVDKTNEGSDNYSVSTEIQPNFVQQLEIIQKISKALEEKTGVPVTSMKCKWPK
jgi:hypothetical protein